MSQIFLTITLFDWLVKWSYGQTAEQGGELLEKSFILFFVSCRDELLNSIFGPRWLLVRQKRGEEKAAKLTRATWAGQGGKGTSSTQIS